MADPEQVHDPRVLRALAHPVRARILDEIEASGPVRAADIAQELDIPANQASFHLRQLAKYGLVEEAPEQARDKRDRVWRASGAALMINLRDVEKAPGGRAAAQVFRRNKLTWGRHLVDRFFGTDHPEGTGIFFSSEYALKLTDEEAVELRVELDALVESWAERTRGRDPARRTYLLYQLAQPYPDVVE